MARRGWGDDAIYWVARRGRYVGAASFGYGPDGKRVRKVVSCKTKQEVKASSRRCMKTSRAQCAQCVTTRSAWPSRTGSAKG
jgi:hypothetical protein